MNFAFKNIEELKELIHSGQTNSRDIWNYFIKRVEKYEPKIQAFNFINQNGFNESKEVLG